MNAVINNKWVCLYIGFLLLGLSAMSGFNRFVILSNGKTFKVQHRIGWLCRYTYSHVCDSREEAQKDVEFYTGLEHPNKGYTPVQ
jgi:hypothetical protein